MERVVSRVQINISPSSRERGKFPFEVRKPVKGIDLDLDS